MLVKEFKYFYHRNHVIALSRFVRQLICELLQFADVGLDIAF